MSESEPPPVLVPALVGLEVADAHERALEAGLVAVGTDLDTPPPTIGVVIGQEPPAGTQVPAGNTVVIHVRSDSGGPDDGPGGGGGGLPDPVDPEPVAPAGTKPSGV
jgi:beta-lactam-binding protein with PASTA domain